MILAHGGDIMLGKLTKKLSELLNGISTESGAEMSTILYGKISNCNFAIIRHKPDKYGFVVKVLKEGTPVIIMDAPTYNSEWTKIRFNNRGEIGFVPSNFCKEVGIGYA